MSMALVMSGMPDVIRKVLAEHVPDGVGRCSACSNLAGETASWPCQTYRVAQEAQWVGGGGLPGAGPHGPLVPGAPAARTGASADRLEPAAGRRPEPPYSFDEPATGDIPGLAFDDDALGSSYPPPETGGRRRRDDDEFAGAPFGSRMDAPYGASFGVDDRPRHAAP